MKLTPVLLFAVATASLVVGCSHSDSSTAPKTKGSVGATTGGDATTPGTTPGSSASRQPITPREAGPTPKLSEVVGSYRLELTPEQMDAAKKAEAKLAELHKKADAGDAQAAKQLEPYGGVKDVASLLKTVHLTLNADGTFHFRAVKRDTQGTFRTAPGGVELTGTKVDGKPVPKGQVENWAGRFDPKKRRMSFSNSEVTITLVRESN